MNMANKVLVVDDEREAREEISDFLSRKGFSCLEASGVDRAVDLARNDRDVSIVVTDIMMPGKDGFDLIETARAEVPHDLRFIMMTGKGGAKAAIQALRKGAQDFLEKPVDLAHLLRVVRKADENLHMQNHRHYSSLVLEAEVKAKAAEIGSLKDSLVNSYEEALKCLAIAAEYKEGRTNKHLDRIGLMTRHVARVLGWSEERQRALELAAPLHDVGKIGVPDAVLLKKGKLTPVELKIMRRHANIGHEILSMAQCPVMELAAAIALSHHESWDGKGYPCGLVGDEIPVEARIVGLCDVYDALRSKRTYKPEFSHKQAMGIILMGDKRVSSSHFDPCLRDLFYEEQHAFNEIFEGGKEAPIF
jgi:putative two-component system response regulator